MLSIANVGGSKDAGRYYEKADDYYTKDRSPSQWQGEAAEVLKLQGEVKLEDFRNLLDGVLPNGEMIQVSGSGRRGGTDLTFSAPKSVSMQALIGEDMNLIDAHDRAVAQTLAYAENLVGYRQTVNGETGRFLSKNMAAATFRHELSRACDPQLHTHCVVLNLTQREDGKWRAMENELFYRQKMLMGAYYRAELAREVQKLGYDIRLTHSDGRFELSHITDSQIELFSQRSQAIEEALKKNGSSRESASAEEKKILTIATRPKKSDVDRQILKEYWVKKGREAQIDFKKERMPREMGKASKLTISETVRFAVDHLMERQAATKESQIVREALQYGIGKTTYHEIKSEMDRQVKVGLLIRDGDRYTNPEAQECEKAILRFEKQGRGLTRTVLSKEEAYSQLGDRGLNKGQRRAAELILSSSNRVVGVQGLAGTGKTYMLQAARELAETKDFKMIGLAPSAAAAHELSKTGIESKTIASFQAQSLHSLSSKSILVIDEAGMVPSKDMEFLLKTAEKHHAKVLMIGDTQQLKAIEAGKPFAQLQAKGMETAGMSEIQRQRNPELKKAVELAAKGEIEKSVSLLQKSIYEIKNPEGRYSQIAKDYLALSERERKETLMVSGTNEARKAINQRVREGLGLNGKGVGVEVLERKDLTQAQIKEMRNYQMGDIVSPEKDYPSLGLKKGDLCPIHSIKKAYLLLQRPDGSFIKWKPHKKSEVSVFQKKKMELNPGEIVRVTQNERRKGLSNGDRARLIGMDPDKRIHLRREDGKVFHLDASKPLHLEYGYCSTVHSAQGRTCKKILIEADTKSLTSSRESYYVAISRARSAAQIYTNDREKIPKAMSRKNEKESALDLNVQFQEKQRADREQIEKAHSWG